MIESLPYGNFIYSNNKDNLNTNFPGFYNILISYDTDLPVLPEKSIKLYFKTRNISGWYWNEKIEFCINILKINNIIIHEGYISQNNGKILVDFIEELNRIRELDPIREKIDKLLINPFYGRLALKEELNNIIISDEIPNSKIYGKIEEFYITKIKKHKITKSNIAIASAITSKARIKLYQAFLDVINSGGRVLYCDTDSVFAEYKHDKIVEDINIGNHIFFNTKKNMILS